MNLDKGVADSIWGTVQVKPPSASTWTTCTWSVDSVEFGYQSRLDFIGSLFTYTYGSIPMNRASFQVDSACKLKTSWFLPQALETNGPTASDSAGGLWYQGDVTDSFSDSGSFSGTTCYMYSEHDIQTYFVSSMSPGDTFIAK